jgi:FKBP-type peptidyl-prolyl cis-trans isomerase 2
MQDMPIGLEEALIGLNKGEKKIITIPPSKGFGKRREGMLIELPRSNFEEEHKLAPNRLVEIISKEGVRYLGSVKDIKKDTVILDLNHPLAGETLLVDVEVVDFVPDENRQTTQPIKNGIDRSKTYRASKKKRKKENFSS